MGILNSLFKSYLSQRTQFVSLTQTDCTNLTLNRYSTSSTVILHAVPQGSNLASLSFLEYINDLPLIFQAVNFVLCADDINITVADKQEKALQDKITSVTQLCIRRVWPRTNDLIVNSEKEEQYHFIPTKIDILGDLTLCLIQMKMYTVQN
jgi:hypothetical protein